MSEARLVKYVLNNIGHKGHFSCVESHLTSAGFPDIDYCINGVEGHLEVKYYGSKGLILRPTQCAWLRQRLKAGGRPLLLWADGQNPQTYYLVKGPRLPELVKSAHLPWWVERSHRVWGRVINFDELVEELTLANY